MAGCGGADSSEEAKKDKDEKAKEKPILVEIHEVQRGVIEVLLERSAALQAERQVQVLARQKTLPSSCWSRKETLFSRIRSY